MEQQRGFTLLEMMLVALLAGIAASLVMMAFPYDRQSDSAWQMAYFRAQLDFAVEESQLNEHVLGVRIYQNRWQFIELLPNNGGETSRSHSDQFLGYHWQPWRPQSITPSATLPARLRLELQDIKSKKVLKRNTHEEVSNGRDDEPDILILPGGEVTPFRLVFNAEPKTQNAWVQVDAVGNIMTSQDAQEKRTSMQGARL